MLKKSLYISFLPIILSGCVTNNALLNDQLNNQFTLTQSIAAPSDMHGTWTGSLTSWLATFQINGDGSGLYCYSSPLSNGVQKIKYTGEQILIQDGTKFNITSYSAERLMLQGAYKGSSNHTLIKDGKLSEASVFCKQQLN